MPENKSTLRPTANTRKIQLIIALCSVLFTIGTALHNFVIVNPSLIETMMQMAGAPDPAGAALGFTTNFRIIGSIYILGNALGILALRSRSAALWWLVFAVNVTQGLGFALIPSSMWIASMDAYGVWGILPSAITDGGAIILAFFMLYTMVKYRAPWAQRRQLIK